MFNYLFKQKVLIKVIFSLCILLTGFLFYIAYSSYILEKMKIKGSLYSEIIQGKDIIADILPPPEYIIESQLYAYQLLGEKRKNEALSIIAKLEKLKKDYYERNSYWKTALDESELKKTLTVDSFLPADQFFQVLNAEYIPNILNNNYTASEKILTEKLVPLYEKHRESVDKTVIIADSLNRTNEQKAEEFISQGRLFLFLAALFSILISFSLALFTNMKMLVTPLKSLLKAVRRMENGDFQAELGLSEVQDTKDELNLFSQSLSSVIEKIKTVIRKNQDLINTLVKSSKEISSSSDSFNESFQSQSVSSEEISAAIEEIGAGIRAVNSSSRKQNSDLKHFENELSHFFQLIENLGKHISSQTVISEKIAADSGKNTDSMKQMNESLQNILKSSRDMSGISEIIKNISKQVNLLALNASIEAARAGESGKGFSVVADQISNLAERTASSIRKIDSILENNSIEIRNSMAHSDEAIKTALHTQSGISSMAKLIQEEYRIIQEHRDINEKVQKGMMNMESISGQIEQSMQEHLKAIEDIEESMNNIIEKTQRNAIASEEISLRSSALLHLSIDLDTEIRFFKL